MKISPWNTVTSISVPSWLCEHQHKLQQAKYETDATKMNLVFECAKLNMELAKGAPLAACVFTKDGALVSVGVDAPGIGGHEMTNALILASNILGSDKIRSSKDLEIFSLAPPCAVCQGNIFSETPSRFVCSVTHQDMLQHLTLPNTPIPHHNWQQELRARGIVVDESYDRNTGIMILSSFRA